MTEHECQQCRHRQDERCMRLRAEVSDRARELEGLQKENKALDVQLRLLVADLRTLESAVLEQLLAEPLDVSTVPSLAAYIVGHNLLKRGA